jgi:hypothetical protein
MGAAWVRDEGDMAGFPGFSSFELFASGLAAGFIAGFAPVLSAALGWALDLTSLALGIRPPEISSWFHHK